MVDRDRGIIGATLTSIIGVIALVSGIPELKAFGAVIVGATVTYVVQTQLQNQVEKNRIRKQNMEETLIPVLLMLRDIKRNIETAGVLEAQENWHQYKQNYKRFIFTEDFYNELEGFFKTYSDYRVKLNILRRIFFLTINKLFEQSFFIKIEPQLNLFQSEGLPCFSLNWKDYYYDQVPFDGPLILGYDPFVVYQRKFENFSIRNVEVVADVIGYDENGNQTGKNEHKIQLKRHMDLFNEFITAVKYELDNKQDVKDLRELNHELITTVSKSISKLENYINKHYPVEPIR